MKGVLFIHLRRYLEVTHPQIRWDDLLCECGITQLFAGGWDYPDHMMQCIVEAAARDMSSSPAEVFNGFGRHSMLEFRKNFHWYFDGHANAASFFLALNETHADAVEYVAGASPPHFQLTSEGDDVLVLAYRSPRMMLAYLRGAIDGILEIYREKAEIALLDSDEGGCRLRIKFL